MSLASASVASVSIASTRPTVRHQHPPPPHLIHTHGHAPAPAPAPTRRPLRPPPAAQLPASQNPAFRAVCALPCVGRVASPPGTTLPPTLARFVSCAPLTHPRYPFGTFVIASKTNSIGIVQAADSTSGILGEEYTMGELASLPSFFQATDGGADPPTRFTLLHETPLSVLLHTYLSQGVRVADALQPAQVAGVLRHALDVQHAKVYCVRPSPTQPHLLALGTSVGTVLLRYICQLPAACNVTVHCIVL